MDVISLLGSGFGLAFASGLNLYATVLLVGLGIRFGFFAPTGAFEALAVLAHPIVIGTAAAITVAEFVADKIPWFDSIWDSVHTVIRPLGAALIGAAAIGALKPEWEIAAFLVCAMVGLASHSTAAGTRLAANTSPEPFTNWALSLTKDGLVIAVTWLAVKHPVITFFFVLAFLVVFVLLIRTIWGWMRRLFGRGKTGIVQRAA